MEKDNEPKRESVADALKKYNISDKAGDKIISDELKREGIDKPTPAPAATIPRPSSTSATDYEELMGKETDPDLMISYEIVNLPSKGMFYPSKIAEVNVEYMTSKDEDLLTTPSLLESGRVLDVLLKRKIKTNGIIVSDLLEGDRNAILLFLRTSSYGTNYAVQVTDPRNGNTFETNVDLTRLSYKENTIKPDESGHFSVKIPMRKKLVVFRLLSLGITNDLFKKAESIMEAYNEEFNQYNTMKLKASIISINDNTDRTYINKFVDAMPALDAYTIRKEIIKVSPDVDMEYEFMASDGYKFKTKLSIGVDFFFPNS